MYYYKLNKDTRAGAVAMWPKCANEIAGDGRAEAVRLTLKERPRRGWQDI